MFNDPGRCSTWKWRQHFPSFPGVKAMVIYSGDALHFSLGGNCLLHEIQATPASCTLVLFVDFLCLSHPGNCSYSCYGSHTPGGKCAWVHTHVHIQHKHSYAHTLTLCLLGRSVSSGCSRGEMQTWNSQGTSFTAMQILVYTDMA